MKHETDVDYAKDGGAYYYNWVCACGAKARLKYAWSSQAEEAARRHARRAGKSKT